MDSAVSIRKKDEQTANGASARLELMDFYWAAPLRSFSGSMDLTE